MKKKRFFAQQHKNNPQQAGQGNKKMSYIKKNRKQFFLNKKKAAAATNVSGDDNIETIDISQEEESGFDANYESNMNQAYGADAGDNYVNQQQGSGDLRSVLNRRR